MYIQNCNPTEILTILYTTSFQDQTIGQTKKQMLN